MIEALQTLASHPALLLLAFAAFWFGGAAAMSRIAGWHALAARFPAPLHARGEQRRFASVSIGPASFPITYRRCVRVLFTDDGLGLCLMFPFRFHSPPFLVPWRRVTGCVEKQLFATRKVTLSFDGVERRVTFSGPLGQEVKARWEASRPAPQAPGSDDTPTR